MGSLNYAAVWTRADIAYPVAMLGRYLNDPREPHMRALKWVLRYVKGTRAKSLHYWPEGQYHSKVHSLHPHHLISNGRHRAKAESDTNTMGAKLIGYADASYATDIDTRRSVTGFAWFLGGNLISYASKVQKVVALSTAEAEYIALCRSMQEMRYIQTLVTEMEGLIDVSKALIYEDNEACVKMATNQMGSSRTKHVEIKYHYCRENVEAGNVVLVYVPTQLQLADTLTKHTTRDTQKRHTWAWGLRDSAGSHWTHGT